MKTSTSYFAVGLVLMVAAASLAYSLQTSARMRDLEQRLQRAEAALQSQNRKLEARVRQDELSARMSARVGELEERLQRAEAALQSQNRMLEARVRQDELSATQPRFIELNGTAGLNQRVQIIGQPMPPRLEPPRLTPRHWEPSDLEPLVASAPSP